MRRNHYERAFERYLRALSRPYLSNRQERRFLLDDAQTLKNFDDVVQRYDGASWIVDVKGRRFPSGGRSRRYWKNWTTWDDLASLARWEGILGFGGARYDDRSAFVFAYALEGVKTPIDPSRLFRYLNVYYAFYVVTLKTCQAETRLVSPKWRTYEIPARRFREVAIPADEFFVGAPVLFHDADPSAFQLVGQRSTSRDVSRRRRLWFPNDEFPYSAGVAAAMASRYLASASVAY